jgi:hypothetical protein
VRAARGELTRALPLQVNALQGFRRLGERLYVAASLEALGALLAGIGQVERAARLLVPPAGCGAEPGRRPSFADPAVSERAVAAAQAALGDAAFTAAWAEALPPPWTRCWPRSMRS